MAKGNGSGKILVPTNMPYVRHVRKTLQNLTLTSPKHPLKYSPVLIISARRIRGIPNSGTSYLIHCLRKTDVRMLRCQECSAGELLRTA